jgi:uncharacterized protein with GYD domain
MATFIATIKFTDKGVEAIRATTKRAAAFKATASRMGVKVTDAFWTLGPFDGVIVFDAPNDKTATAAMLELSSRGNVQTTTARAFRANEMTSVIGALPKKK